MLFAPMLQKRLDKFVGHYVPNDPQEQLEVPGKGNLRLNQGREDSKIRPL